MKKCLLVCNPQDYELCRKIIIRDIDVELEITQSSLLAIGKIISINLDTLESNMIDLPNYIEENN